jgi:CDP-diacylglycerol--glycerol-3-phosphate 3-phosphatidyltransferase
MVSYAKARAEGLGLECKTGLLARPERVIILAIGLLSGTSICIWALAFLAVFSNVTAVERIISVWRMTRHSMKMPQHVHTSEPDTSVDNRHVPTSVGTNEV